MSVKSFQVEIIERFLTNLKYRKIPNLSSVQIYSNQENINLSVKIGSGQKKKIKNHGILLIMS